MPKLEDSLKMTTVNILEYHTCSISYVSFVWYGILCVAGVWLLVSLGTWLLVSLLWD